MSGDVIHDIVRKSCELAPMELICNPLSKFIEFFVSLMCSASLALLLDQFLDQFHATQIIIYPSTVPISI